jgi:hypothetical protein
MHIYEDANTVEPHVAGPRRHPKTAQRGERDRAKTERETERETETKNGIVLTVSLQRKYEVGDRRLLLLAEIGLHQTMASRAPPRMSLEDL